MIKDKTSVEAPIVRADDGYFKRIHVEEGGNTNTAGWLIEEQPIALASPLSGMFLDILSGSTIRSAQLSRYVIPHGKISSIGLVNANQASLTSVALWMSVYVRTDVDSDTYSFVAVSKTAVKPSDAGQNGNVVWEFDPEELVFTKDTDAIRLNWSSVKEEVMEPIWKFPATQYNLAVKMHTGAVGGVDTQIAASGGKWWSQTPAVTFTATQTVVTTGEPILRTNSLLGSAPIPDVNINEGIILQGTTCFRTNEEMYGIDETEFINNITRYDNLIPTVKMVRLMLQNQAAVAAAVEAAENPVATMEAATSERQSVLPVAAATEVSEPKLTIKTKNDKPRRHKKRNTGV